MPKPQPNLFALAKARRQENPIELQIMAAGLPPSTPEYQFAKSIGRKWAADHAWPEYMILFEIEGSNFGNVVRAGRGTWTTKRVKGEKVRVEIPEGEAIRLGGRHNTGAGMQADCEKYSWAAILGWCVVRATTTMIRDQIAIELLEAAFREQKKRGYPK